MSQDNEILFRLISGSPSPEDLALLEVFDEKIFRPAFPNDDERESLFGDIVPRLGDPEVPPGTYIVLAIRDSEIVGGEICDWYASCSSLEIIYIAVSKSVRTSGIGSRLLEEGTALIVQSIEKEPGARVRRLYFETENPNKEQDERNLVMNLFDRIRFFGKHGGAVLTEDYYQPPLSRDKNWADNMMLCVLPVFRFSDGEVTAEAESAVPLNEAMEFLECFYDGLDHAQETDEGRKYLEMMRSAMAERKHRDGVVLTRMEASTFKIPYVTVATHFFVEASERLLQLLHDDPQDDINVFNSYECDLMRSGLQEYDARPVITRHHCLLQGAKVQLPARYQYTSEGEVFCFRQWGSAPVPADISLNWSYHRQRKRFMVTVVVSPAASDGDGPTGEMNCFSERDILKFITLFGFGSLQEGFRPLSPVRIDCAEGSFSSFDQLVRHVFRLDADPVPTRTGITELDMLDIRGELGFKDFGGFKADILSEGPAETEWNKTLCGLFLGIFDYLRMNSGEIADTVRPLQVRRNYFTQVCRGNLLQIRCNSTDERIGEILCSAYLIIPSVMLAFNQQVLAESKAHLSRTVAGIDPSGKKKRAFSYFDRFAFLSGEVKDIEENLSQGYVQDIFQYESEKLIFSCGSDERGFSRDLSMLKEALAIQKGRADELKDKYTSGIDTIQNIILLVLALLEIANISNLDDISIFSKVGIIVALIVGLAIYFRKRRL